MLAGSLQGRNLHEVIQCQCVNVVVKGEWNEPMCSSWVGSPESLSTRHVSLSSAAGMEEVKTPSLRKLSRAVWERGSRGGCILDKTWIDGRRLGMESGRIEKRSQSEETRGDLLSIYKGSWEKTRGTDGGKN
jgi:hypothetical protein